MVLIMRKEIEIEILRLLTLIGMDTPSNLEKIVDFVCADVQATADPENWHSGDVVIAFRRFVEREYQPPTTSTGGKVELKSVSTPLEIREVVPTGMTPNEVVQHLLDDDDYLENIKDMILFYLEDSNNLRYWKAWFEGKEGKELEDTDIPLIFVADSYYARCPHGNLIKFSWGVDDLFYTLDSKGKWQQSNPDLFEVTQIKIVGAKECDTQPPTV